MNVAAPVDSALRHIMERAMNVDPPVDSPFCHRPTTQLPSEGFNQCSIRKTYMAVGSGEQRVSHVTHCDGFVGYAIESACAPEVTETWVVCIVHSDLGDQPPTQILAHSSTELGCGARPTSMHISKDHVLALSLGTGGLKTYGLHYDGVDVQPYELCDLSMPNHYHLYCKWIAVSNEGHCLVSRVQNAPEDTLWVHSCVKGRRNAQDLLKADMDTIMEVDASAPGNIAVLLCTHKVHTLTRSHTGGFVQRTINLESLAPGAPAVCVAIGNRMLMVSLLGAPTLENEKSGEILCFNLESGEVTNRRQCKGVATALATEGSKCLFGVTCPGESALYGLYEGKCATFTFSDEIGEMVWRKGSVYVDNKGWSCGVTFQDDECPGCNASVVEYCVAELH